MIDSSEDRSRLLISELFLDDRLVCEVWTDPELDNGAENELMREEICRQSRGRISSSSDSVSLERRDEGELVIGLEYSLTGLLEVDNDGTWGLSSLKYIDSASEGFPSELDKVIPGDRLGLLDSTLVSSSFKYLRNSS